MKKTTTSPAITEFEQEVIEGLTDFPKHLSSKFFYDKKGDRLFQEIMNLPEYYLTNCEFNILKKHAGEIVAAFKGKNGFDLIELGAGNGKKTKILLQYLSNKKVQFTYLPIDISHNVLDELETSLKKELPHVKVKIQQGTYFKILENLTGYNSRKKVILMLGSNIGNLLHKQAISFLQDIRKAMNRDDMLFMGFDQKKDPQTILNAYNDPTGITEAFNKNILIRINTEFNADFEPSNFLHWEVYNPETGTAKSFLVSKIEQKVKITGLGLDIHFDPWETIHTEISQKYDDSTVAWLAGEAGLQILSQFTDEKGYYKNYIFKKST